MENREPEVTTGGELLAAAAGGANHLGVAGLAADDLEVGAPTGTTTADPGATTAPTGATTADPGATTAGSSALVSLHIAEFDAMHFSADREVSPLTGTTAAGSSALVPLQFAEIDAAGDATAAGGATAGSSALVPPSERKYDEFQRLHTFPLEWPAINVFTKPQLAKDGIYYDSTRREYRCAFCDAQFDVSERADLVNNYHRRLSPNCPVVTNTAALNRPLEPANNYRLERHRRVSFLQTSWTAPVDPFDLAKWGFYWTGTADVGRCHFCRLEVRGWEPGDTGESEHRRWNPNCPFLQDRPVGNVALGAEGELANVLSSDRQAIMRGEGGVQYLGNQQPMPAGELGVTFVTPPRHPQFVTKASRLATYTMWPLSLSQRPQQMVDAGLYYTGKGDRVLCFHCGGGLKDWGQGDQPWVEHAVWFPRCDYLNLVKGQGFIAQVQAVREQQQQQRREGGPTENATNELPSPTQALIAATVLTAEQEPRVAEGSDDRRACKVCLVNELGIVFLPCGHVTTCPDCAPQLTTCPVCRARPSAYVRAYLP